MRSGRRGFAAGAAFGAAPRSRGAESVGAGAGSRIASMAATSPVAAIVRAATTRTPETLARPGLFVRPRRVARLDRAAGEDRAGGAGGVEPAGDALVEQLLHLAVLAQRRLQRAAEPDR